MTSLRVETLAGGEWSLIQYWTFCPQSKNKNEYGTGLKQSDRGIL